MSVLKTINIRPVRTQDLAQLDAWRRQYPSAFLELPKGMSSPGIETAIAEKDGELLASLTGANVAIFDPLIRNPRASRLDIVAAIYLLERTLAYSAQGAGAIDGYIAVPETLKEYHTIVEKSGYTKTCTNCVIFRRPLLPDTHPLIEDEVKFAVRE